MELVDNPYVSDFTRKTLEQFGWEVDDPIPVALGEMLLKFKETLPASARIDVLVDAALLPEESVQAIKEMLAQAKVVYAKKKEHNDQEAKLSNLNPAIRAQYESVLRQLEIVDDRKEAAAATPAEAEPQPTAAAQPAALPETPAPVVLPPEPPRPLILPFCPRCGWDMQQKFDVAITDRDKEDFLVTVLGGTRFRKKFELFGGRLVVTYRGMLAEENKLVYRQLVLDQQENRVATENEWFAQLMDYRLACSLESLSDANGKPIAIVPELDINFKQDKEQPLATPVAAQLEYVNKTVLAQEVTRRIVGLHLRQFQRLVEALEAMAVEPSFWDGIA
jgi:hypothetical protein